MVETVKVGEDGADMRLDRWFRKAHPTVGQIQIEKMCRKGEIRVDGGRVKPATRLSPGQMVRIPPLPDRGPAAPARVHRKEVSEADTMLLRNAVIYRDDDVLVLNKPPGLAVQGGTGTDRHIDGMAEALRFDAAEKPRLVHRLDRDTSGVFLMARSGRAAAHLARSFQARETRKIYWAVVASVPSPRMGTVRYGLVKAPSGQGEKMHAIHPDRVAGTDGAKRATTDYATLQVAGKRAAWLALAPITGRTHQLRVHMAEIGCPIVGDGKYGTNRQTNEGDGWGAQLGGEVSRKLHLHARSLRIPHPFSGAMLTLTAPLPPHIARTLDLFGWDPAEVPADPFEEI